MKKLSSLSKFKFFLVFLTSLFIQTISFAQDSSGDGSQTNVTHTETQSQTVWYTEPWVWVVAAIVLILIIWGLSRGSNTSRRDVTVTKTTTRDDV